MEEPEFGRRGSLLVDSSLERSVTFHRIERPDSVSDFVPLPRMEEPEFERRGSLLVDRGGYSLEHSVTFHRIERPDSVSDFVPLPRYGGA